MESEIKIAVLTPSIGFPRIEYTYSLVRMIQYFYHNEVFPGVPQSIAYIPRVGSGISSNRETLARDVLAGDYTHCIFIDEDHCWEPDCLHILLRRNLPIVGANYRMRIPGGGFTAQAEGRTIETTPESEGVEECVYLGFGLCLIAREVLEAVDKVSGECGMFPQGYMPSTKTFTTEDYGFSVLTKECGYKSFVDHDVSKRISHVGSFQFNYSDVWD